MTPTQQAVEWANDKETVQDNGVITKPPKYEILNSRCLSSKHGAYIEGVLNGACECGNCKIRVRQHRYHEGAFIGETSHHDYVNDVEEVVALKDRIIKNT